MKTNGNKILITGGSSGIGLALAQWFFEHGNQVIVTGRDLDKLRAVENQYPEIDVFKCDLTNNEELGALVHYIEQNHSDINILINNAAVQYNYLFEEVTHLVHKIDYEISANLNGPIKLTAMLLPLISGNGSGAIVNVSSGLFMAPKKNASVYCATKAGIHSFSKSLRYQLENTSVKVFELIPSLIDTPMTAGRGRDKISPQILVKEFIHGFRRDRYEIYIGKTKILKLISRITPRLAARIMKEGK
ncbi:MAG: SDR family oxidoreductase [Saprospiraceae bacterium]|nr:SDR family oxidoreductase [Saprospiraceae bacterium]